MVVGFHTIDAVQQFLRGEQRMLPGSASADVIESGGHGFRGLLHRHVELTADGLAVVVIDSSGFFVQGYGLALDATMQECVAWLIDVFEHRALQLGCVAASHLRQSLSVDRQPVVQVAAGQRWQ
ncbi:hypothetical protein D3C87_1106990 [compost metagenome]